MWCLLASPPFHQLLIYSVFLFLALKFCGLNADICLISDDIMYLSFSVLLIGHLDILFLWKACSRFFSIFTKLSCLPISYWSIGILYILDARFLPYTHIHTHTHTHTHMSMWEQNPHIALTPTKFWCEMNDKKTFMVLIDVVYSILTAVSLKLMNILWTDSIWGHCPCHQFHSALCRDLKNMGWILGSRRPLE